MTPPPAPASSFPTRLRRRAGSRATVPLSRRRSPTPASRPTSRTPRATTTSTRPSPTSSSPRAAASCCSSTTTARASPSPRRPRPRASRSSPTTVRSSGADYYVSFDNDAGRRRSRASRSSTASRPPARTRPPRVVVYMGGDPTDGNATMFHDGAVAVMEAAGIKPGARAPGNLGRRQVRHQLRAGADLARWQGRRRLGCQRHQRRRRHHDPRQEPQRPSRSRVRTPRRRSAERAARQADRHGLQAGQARGRGRFGPRHRSC